jgi:HK97 family phage major capsid protein
MARASATAIRKLKDGNGEYLWSMDKGLNNRQMNFLLGAPVHFAADVAAIASSSLSAFYGDFKRGYLIVDRVGIRILRDPYSSKPYIVFYTTKRVGGGVVDGMAIKAQILSA